MENKHKKYLPRSGADIPRFAGIPTFMRLPHVDMKTAMSEVDVGMIGVPISG